MALKQAGMNSLELARRIGIHRHCLKRAYSATPAPRPRHKIEEVLGPVWATTEEHERRLWLARKIGCDPYLTQIMDLVRIGRKLGLVKGRPPRKAALIETLSEHFRMEEQATASRPTPAHSVRALNGTNG